MSAFRGLPLYLLLFCAAQEILTPATIPEKFLLGPHHAGKLTVGMPESAIQKFWSQTHTRKIVISPEGIETPAVQIFVDTNQKKPSLVVILNAETTIFGIEVHDPRFRTAQGIGVGSSIGDLRKSHLRFEFSTEESEGLICDELGMKFDLNVDPATDRRLDGHKADPLTVIPPGLKIGSIWVH